MAFLPFVRHSLNGAVQRIKRTGRLVSPLNRLYATETSPKTFSNQSIIPRLPIPTLKETLERYKKSLLPLLTHQDYLDASKAIDDFAEPGKLGDILQFRLYELDRKEKYNWLETIWFNKAYLEWREPTLINVNWWCEFRDPKDGILKKPPPKGEVSDFQINRTAGLISNLLNFSDGINNETFPPEYTRQGPLCMNQYKHQFGTTRIPDFPADRIVTSWPATATHIIVLYRDQIFKVPVIANNGARVPIKELEKQLKLVVKSVSDDNLQPPIGLLTGEHRDIWAAARKALESLTYKNLTNFETIDTALFAVALDDYSTDTNIDISHNNIFHAFNGRNRWFDKSLQLIVQSNGRAGVNGEHSPADAVIPGRIFDDVVSNEPAQDPQNANSSVSLPPPHHLEWLTDTWANQLLEEAQKKIKSAIDNVDSVLLHYKEYGSDWLKSAKLSPDAFVQMALQLAYHRQYGKPTATYESASTRGFLHGRTETVRTCSVDSVAFTKAFDDKELKKEEKLALFTKAVKTHLEYMISASTGKGVDRHFLGLRTQIKDDGERSRATIFTHPSFIQSMYFKLSTSNMSPGDNFYGGFGAVVPDGYGVNYAIGKDNIKFSISSYKSAAETNSATFRNTLSSALNDLRSALNK